MCFLDLCPQDTKRSFKLENNQLQSSLGRQQHFSSAQMLQGSGKPGVTLMVVWSSEQEPGEAVLHTIHCRGCWTAWAAGSQHPTWEQTQDVFNSYADVNPWQ